MAQAFAYYDFDETQGRLVYTPGTVQREVLHQLRQLQAGLRHAGRSAGRTAGARARTRVLGWSTALPGSGTGAKSLGEELANSDAFAQCQVEKVFKAVCFRAPGNASRSHRGRRHRRHDLQGDGYSLKQVFAETAVYCMGD